MHSSTLYWPHRVRCGAEVSRWMLHARKRSWLVFDKLMPVMSPASKILGVRSDDEGSVVFCGRDRTKDSHRRSTIPLPQIASNSSGPKSGASSCQIRLGQFARVAVVPQDDSWLSPKQAVLRLSEVRRHWPPAPLVPTSLSPGSDCLSSLPLSTVNPTILRSSTVCRSCDCDKTP